MFNLYIRLISVLILPTVFGKATNKTKFITFDPLSDILSKFHQNDYKLAFERTELVRVNKSFGECYLRTFKYNRTTPLVNASFASTIDLGYDLEIIVQGYKFASNEYRFFPLRLQVNVCKAIASSAAGADKVSTFGNMKCPLVKGKIYYYYNYAPEEANLPPFIPTGQYMFEFQFLYHDSEVLVSTNYVTIYRPIVMQ